MSDFSKAKPHTSVKARQLQNGPAIRPVFVNYMNDQRRMIFIGKLYIENVYTKVFQRKGDLSVNAWPWSPIFRTVGNILVHAC